MAINVDMVLNANKVLSEARNVADVFEDMGDSLDDVTRDGDKAGEKLEDALRGAQRETEKTERSFKDLADTVAKESRDAGRKIDDNIGDGLDKAKDGLNDFKGEAGSTAREGAASFTGEWDDVGDIVQETLANALGGFGPIGAAAGVALAAGFGALYAKVQADAEAAEERVSAMYSSMIASQSSYLAESEILSGVEELIDTTESYTEAQEIAAASGVDLGTVLRAMAGDADAAAEVQAALNEQLQIAKDNANKAAEENRDLTKAEQDQALAAGKANDAMSKYSEAVEKASEKYNAYADAARRANNQMQDAAVKAAGLRKEIVQLPNGKTITVTLGVDETAFNGRVNRALNNARALASKGIAVDFQVTRNGTKVY